MTNIKELVSNRFKILSILSTSILFSVMLLTIRIKVSNSFFYLFLVWNLFLAIVPYAITIYLQCATKINKLQLVFWFTVWLLFLPNAPYIITDLIHLRINSGFYIWLDVLLVSSFACNGILLFYLSILDMKELLLNYLSTTKVNYLLGLIFFLSSFGVYLGRFLRYNSWELLSNPIQLLLDIINIVVNPIFYKEAWLFTFLFGLFLNLGFCVLQIFIKHSSKN